MREHLQQFVERGARLAAIGLGDVNYARLFREKNHITFPLLIDDQRVAYGELRLKKANLLHLFRRDNMQARKRAKLIGARQHRLGKDPFQLGGSFVFGPGNVDRFVHISETFGDNAQPQDLLAALDSQKLRATS
ncbi:MAG: peroxiredoxin-like family protein [Actinomycetota bacterium]